MLTIRKDDFAIRTENFELTNEWNILRIIAGSFLLPHVASKFLGWEGTVGFFAKAGFAPPEMWVYFAAAVELFAGVMLVLGLCTRFAALAAAVTLFVAAFALLQVKGLGWLWNKGGFEYPVFWGLTCLTITIHQFRTRAVASDGMPLTAKANSL